MLQKQNNKEVINDNYNRNISVIIIQNVGIIYPLYSHFSVVYLKHLNYMLFIFKFSILLENPVVSKSNILRLFKRLLNRKLQQIQ